MVVSTYDIFKGRRTQFEKCLLWKGIKGKDRQSIAKEYKPSQIFYAEEENPQSNGTENLDSFHYKKKRITISTYDRLEIEADDIVKFNDIIWRVDNTQIDEEHRNNQFAKTVSRKTYIYLEA